MDENLDAFNTPAAGHPAPCFGPYRRSTRSTAWPGMFSASALPASRAPKSLSEARGRPCFSGLVVEPHNERRELFLGQKRPEHPRETPEILGDEPQRAPSR